jgi:lysozyme
MLCVRQTSFKERAMLNGIDVYYKDGVIPWPTLKAAGNAFVIARAAYGDVEDTRVEAYVDGIRRSGMALGVYHFLRTSKDYQKQIDLMLELIQRLGIGPGDLPPALDVEDNPVYDGPWQTANNDKYLTAVDRWITAVTELTGRTPILYTRAGFWATLGNPGGFSHCPLWVAHYGAVSPRLPAGWTDYAFWQYTDKGSVPGVNAKVDMNRFNGDAAALASLLMK